MTQPWTQYSVHGGELRILAPIYATGGFGFAVGKPDVATIVLSREEIAQWIETLQSAVDPNVRKG